MSAKKTMALGDEKRGMSLNMSAFEEAIETATRILSILEGSIDSARACLLYT